MIRPTANALVSFHYFGKFDLDQLSRLRLIGDSGAYSARVKGIEISNAQLAAWAKQWRHRLAWVASLDIAGDIPATRRNWHTLVDGHGIPAVSSLHVGTDPAEMDYYAAHGVDFLGLGGMAGGNSSPKRQLRWLIDVFRYARTHHPQMRFHGWGVTNRSMMRLPFWSVDSSGWAASYRYGLLALHDPRTGKPVQVRMDGSAAYDRDIAYMLRDHYGVTPSQLARSTAANRELVIRVSALSAAAKQDWFRRMHGTITSPTWGQLNGCVDGPHMHLAEAAPRNITVLNDMLTEVPA
ncbi:MULTISPECIES: hypothetical protein [unclassified Nocardia]|uniref:hypothetical protein n=1 Tax=unclassified Nocardia TaxID=2637762 RepID=UPI00278C193A|nr:MULTISPECIES: hypothetical protein [unclassified Nocardia]